jgi:hypothetical protein
MPSPVAPNSPVFNALFQTPTPAMGVSQYLTKGSLIVFKYSFWMHDPYPLVIVSDYMFGIKIRGVNLHYLTYPIISNILGTVCTSKTFSYSNIKSNTYISSAFRTYKWSGISQVKRLDCNTLLKVISGVRSIDPSQTEAIKQSVQDQLNRTTNPNLDQSNQGTVPVVGQVATVGQQNQETQNNQSGALNG